MRKFKNYIVALSLIGLLGLAGCSGEDTKDIESTSNTTYITSISGVAVDGYIKDATVCLDLNLNNICEDNEPYTITDENGLYSLDVEAVGEYQLIMLGGIDTATNTRFNGVLKEIVELDENTNEVFAIISPLTTISAQLYKQEKELDSSYKIVDSKEVIAKNLGLSLEQISADPMQDYEVFTSVQQIIQTTKIIVSNMIIDDTQEEKVEAFNYILNSISKSIAKTTREQFDISKIIEDVTSKQYNGQNIILDNVTKENINIFVAKIEDDSSVVLDITTLSSLQNELNKDSELIQNNTMITNIQEENISNIKIEETASTTISVDPFIVVPPSYINDNTLGEMQEENQNLNIESSEQKSMLIISLPPSIPES